MCPFVMSDTVQSYGTLINQIYASKFGSLHARSRTQSRAGLELMMTLPVGVFACLKMCLVGESFAWRCPP